MRNPAIILAAAITLCAGSPSIAQESGSKQDQAKQQDETKPVKDRDVTAVDVAATPIDDLNLRKADIPPLLLAAEQSPYDLTGLKHCSDIAAAVRALDDLLGDDIDLPVDEKQGPRPGKLAQWFVGTFIPFRGALRELSGANEQKRRMGAAVEAGMTRRGFLKGVGQARGCRYPAGPATQAIIAQHAAALEAERARKEDAKKDGKSDAKQ